MEISEEKKKMLAGEMYDASDNLLKSERLKARALCNELNRIDPSDVEGQKNLLTSLFGKEVNATVTPPFFCDYGYNIDLGDNAYFNFNCVILDVVKVTIGSNTLFGPGVHIYTATHPLSVQERRSGKEFGKPVIIGNDVWVGGSSVICPRVSIGEGSIIGAGSVVTKDIPAGVIAVGNPCRVIKKL